VGTRASANVLGSSAFGVDSEANGKYSTAIGYDAQAVDESSVAVGARAIGDGVGSSAFGMDSLASGDDSTAIGSSAQAVDRSVAVGTRAAANGVGSIAFGVDSEARAISSTAVGYKTQALGDKSVALGVDSFVRQSGTHGVALGAKTGVSGKDSIALGYGSRADEANALSIGNGNGRGGPATRRIVNLSSGNVSLTSTDAVNGGQFFQALSSMASVLGGGAAIGAQGALIAPVYQIQGMSYTNVGAALKALDGKVTDLDHRVGVYGDVNHDVKVAASVATANASDAMGAGAGKVVASVAASDSSHGTDVMTSPKGNGVATVNTESKVQGAVVAVNEQAQLGSAGSGLLNGRQAVSASMVTLGANGVDKVQLDSGIAAANGYTDARFSALNDSFESLRSDLNGQIHRQDRRLNRQGAMSAAMLNMATSAAGIHTQNRVGAGVGFQNGQAALSIGYQRAISDKSTVTIGGAFSSSDSSIGVGAGFGW
ncbi:MAG TPA: YadA-like family protein, partial [Xylella sp.]